MVADRAAELTGLDRVDAAMREPILAHPPRETLAVDENAAPHPGIPHLSHGELIARCQLCENVISKA